MRTVVRGARHLWILSSHDSVRWGKQYVSSNSAVGAKQGVGHSTARERRTGHVPIVAPHALVCVKRISQSIARALTATLLWRTSQAMTHLSISPCAPGFS